MARLAGNQLGFEYELENAFILHCLSKFSIGCRENCDDYSCICPVAIYDITNSKFRHGGSSSPTRCIHPGVEGVGLDHAATVNAKSLRDSPTSCLNKI